MPFHSPVLNTKHAKTSATNKHGHFCLVTIAQRNPGLSRDFYFCFSMVFLSMVSEDHDMRFEPAAHQASSPMPTTAQPPSPNFFYAQMKHAYLPSNAGVTLLFFNFVF